MLGRPCKPTVTHPLRRGPVSTQILTPTRSRQCISESQSLTESPDTLAVQKLIAANTTARMGAPCRRMLTKDGLPGRRTHGDTRLPALAWTQGAALHGGCLMSMEPWVLSARRVLLVALTCCAVLLVVLSWLTWEDPEQDIFLDVVLPNAIYICAALICFLPLSVGSERWAMRLIGVTLTLTAIGNLYYSLVLAAMENEPYPSWADVLWLTWYPFVYMAVVLLAIARAREFLLSLWLEGLMVASSVVAVAAVIFIPQLLATAASSPPEAIVNASYPLGDIVLLAIMAGLVTGLRLRVDAKLATLFLGVSFTAIGDLTYLLQTQNDSYVEGGAADLALAAGAVALGFAAAIPSQDRRPAGVASDEVDPAVHLPSRNSARIDWRLVWLPMVALLASLIVLADPFEQTPFLARIFALACIVIAVVRLGLTFRETRDLASARRQALTDELTGLSNRRAFSAAADARLADSPQGEPTSMLLLDLDRFKTINDSLGHATGDRVLMEVASRLTSFTRDEDTLARLGGDEFAVLLPDTTETQALILALELRESLAKVIDFDNAMLHVGASIGVATTSAAISDEGELLRCADVAMYQAKQVSTGVIAYSNLGGDVAGDLLSTTEDLWSVLNDQHSPAGHLLVHLQPQEQVNSRRIVGVESLVRWQHPRRGLLLPGSFLETAAAAGLMTQLTDAVLDLSLSACSSWWSPSRQITVAVNFATGTLQDVALPDRIESAIARSGLPAQALVIEITEESLMANPIGARDILNRIRRMGVRVSIDDYGTGYSSLEYLHDLPADEVKIDKSFVASLADDPAAVSIVRHSVRLAHELGMQVVAEGVEDWVAREMASTLGCDILQGYLIGWPTPLEEIGPWLSREQSRADLSDRRLRERRAHQRGQNVKVGRQPTLDRTDRMARRGLARLSVEQALAHVETALGRSVALRNYAADGRQGFGVNEAPPTMPEDRTEVSGPCE